MDLIHLNDNDLLSQTKRLVQNERQLLIQILHHLREVERRKLFSDLGYQSLFDYAVKELKYSEGQAGRRIQAMRLIKEIPEVEKKIGSGVLSLSNISQAQSYFRHSQLLNPANKLDTKEKLNVLKKFENKSSREGQRVLTELNPNALAFREKERVISPTQTEVKFLMSEKLKLKLEEIRSLLGPEGASMGIGQLIEQLAEIGLLELKARKFGKRRSASSEPDSTVQPEPTPAPESQHVKVTTSQNRYISKANRHQVWQRDSGKCRICKSQRNLNIDHIHPLTLGGDSSPDNLRLLCFNCNQRQAIKDFGTTFIENKISSKNR